MPGKIETWSVLVDCKDVSLFEFPVSGLASMTKRIKRGYKTRAYQIIAVNVHWMIVKAVNFIKKIVSESVAAKIHIVSDNGHDQLSTMLEDASLEQKYGGKHPDLQDNFWPPRYNA